MAAPNVSLINYAKHCCKENGPATASICMRSPQVSIAYSCWHSLLLLSPTRIATRLFLITPQTTHLHTVATCLRIQTNIM